MTDTLTTIVGNLVAAPVLTQLESGRHVMRMRVASTESVWNSETRSFVDGRTSYYNVSAWGTLGKNAAFSFEKGHRVLVHGKLSVEGYQNKDGEPRTSVQIEARALGHDLQFGQTKYGKVRFAAPEPDPGRQGRPEDAPAETSGAPGESGDAAAGQSAARQAEEEALPDYVEIDGMFIDQDGQRVG